MFSPITDLPQPESASPIPRGNREQHLINVRRADEGLDEGHCGVGLRRVFRTLRSAAFTGPVPYLAAIVALRAALQLFHVHAEGALDLGDLLEVPGQHRLVDLVALVLPGYGQHLAHLVFRLNIVEAVVAVLGDEGFEVLEAVRNSFEVELLLELGGVVLRFGGEHRFGAPLRGGL